MRAALVGKRIDYNSNMTTVKMRITVLRLDDLGDGRIRLRLRYTNRGSWMPMTWGRLNALRHGVTGEWGYVSERDAIDISEPSAGTCPERGQSLEVTVKGLLPARGLVYDNLFVDQGSAACDNFR